MNNRADIEITDKYAHDFRNMKIPGIESQKMLPSIRKQGTLEMTSPPSHRCRPGNANRPRSSSHGHKHDHVIDMKKRLKPTEYAYNLYNSAESSKILEGPIDLSASNNVKVETENDENNRIHQIDVNAENIEERRVKLQKNKQKKRKSSLETDENWTIENIAAERIPKQTVNKREEVLKAARSLFSKRTRTLYHWMYPDTSKGKLKAIVSSAWDTLSNTEKEFYISQVLGRFGVPAGSLMVNPQLGGFQNREIVSSSYAILASANNTSTSDIDGNNSIQIISNMSSDEDSTSRFKKRWRKDVDGNDVPSRSHQHLNGSIPSAINYDDDEFADDPELTTELMQFHRAMGNTE